MKPSASALISRDGGRYRTSPDPAAHPMLAVSAGARTIMTLRAPPSRRRSPASTAADATVWSVGEADVPQGPAIAAGRAGIEEGDAEQLGARLGRVALGGRARGCAGGGGGGQAHGGEHRRGGRAAGR